MTKFIKNFEGVVLHRIKRSESAIAPNQAIFFVFWLCKEKKVILNFPLGKKGCTDKIKLKITAQRELRGETYYTWRLKEKIEMCT